MSFLLDISEYNREDVRNLQKALTFTYKNIFGPNLTIQAYIRHNKTKILIPYAVGRKLTQFRALEIKNKNRESWEFVGDLLPEQQEIKDQALPLLIERGSVLLLLPTGFGKSIQATELISALVGKQGGRGLVLFSKEVLEQSWVNTFESSTNAQVGIVPEKNKNFDYRPYQLLVSRMSRIRDEFVEEIDVLVLDEAHELCTQRYLNEILRIRPRYVIILTATLERDDQMVQIMVAIGGGKRHQIEVETIKPYQVFTVRTNIGPKDFPSEDENGLPLQAPDSTRIYLESLLATSELRNKMIGDFLVGISQTKFKIVVFGNIKKQISYLYDYLKEREIDVDFLSGTKKEVNNAKISLFGVKKAGAGFDDKNRVVNWDGNRFTLGIFIIETYKIAQPVGRLRTPIPYLIHFVDTHPWFEKTIRDNMKWYRSHLEEGGEIYSIGKNSWEEVMNKIIEIDEPKLN